ncbi:hypothetical protein DVH26_11430 [Paenibacillus sp. H1-7]|uniref:CBM96 family carbohydrate-binding protein n=1 Tax=Paenibacillus sp. H1-7 TaxID=2282849 RepID=UPI001EF7E051|nr:S-layer homology domain-containing protein [Paenibacillus sp. H1-7]ULL14997.1 hypothetical protein DVH26_11430 [Paenibacillus sp. H1-7]
MKTTASYPWKHARQALQLLLIVCLIASPLWASPGTIHAAFSYGTPMAPISDVSVYSSGYYMNSSLIANEATNYHKAAADGAAQDIMRVGRDEDGSQAYTYVKYDLSGLPAPGDYAEAALQFQASSAVAGPISVYGLQPMQTAADWSETAATWKNKFTPMADSLDTIQITNEAKLYRFNITDYIKSKQAAGAASVSLLIKAETASAVELRGRETTDADGAVRIPSLVIHQQASGLPAPQPYTPPVAFAYGKNMPPLHDSLVYNPATTNNKDADKNYHGTNNTAAIADGMTVEFNKAYAYFKFDISQLPEPDKIGKTVFSVWGRDTSKSTTAPATSYVQIFGTSGSSDWKETDISWNNRPQADAVPLAEVLYKTANNYQDADITQYVKQQKQNGAKTITVMMAAKDQTGIFYHRGKDTNAGGQSPPRLMVSDPAETPEDLTLGSDGRSRLYPADWYPGFKDDKGRYLHDFSYAGYHRGETAIPAADMSRPIDVTKAPYHADATGGSDATSAIQKAIDDAGAQGGGVVYLPEGTYQVNPPAGKDYALRIASSNVVLKGAGMNKTFLYNATENMKGKDIIEVGGTDWKKTPVSTKLSRSVTEPTVLLPVQDAGSFKVNDYVTITFETTQGFLEELGMQNKWASRLGKVEPLFYRQIVGVDAVNRTITLDIPTRFPMKLRDNITITKTENPLSEIGLEDFSIANVQNSKSGLGEDDYKVVGTAGYESDNAKAINLVAVANSWVRNISTYKPEGNATYHILSKGVILDRTKNVTVDNVTMQYPQYRGANGNGYLYQFIGNDDLITNSNAVAARHSFTYANFSANGNVLYKASSEKPSLLTDFHMYMSMANLIDSMTLNGDAISAITRDYGSSETNRHGVVTTESVFWNTTGLAAHSSKNGIIIESEQFGNGYIVGTKGAVSGVNVNITGSIADANTKPFDMAEGVGEGDKLTPQSLYSDQFGRRTDGTKLALQSLLVNGLPIAGMQFTRTSYTYTLPYGTTTVPNVQAAALSPDASVTVTQPASTSGNGVIRVSNGGEVKEYTVQFKVAASPVLPVSITLAPDKSVPGWRAAGNAISVGNSGKLKAILTLDNGETVDLGSGDYPVAYTLNNETVASIQGSVFKALLPGITKVTAEITWNGKTVKSTQTFEVKEPMSEPDGKFATAVKVTASADDGNVPANVNDRDPDSRWSAEGTGGQYLVLELDKEVLIDKASIMFYSGNLRSSTFDLEVSRDGEMYHKVLTRAVSGKPNPNQPETFGFNPVKAKYVKFTGYGNELNAWNSIIEFWVHLAPVQSPQSITLNKTSGTLKVGDTDSLTATVLPENATDKTVTFESSSSAVTVGEAVYQPLDGTTSVSLKAIAAGNAFITARTVDGGLTAKYEVNVTGSGTGGEGNPGGGGNNGGGENPGGGNPGEGPGNPATPPSTIIHMPGSVQAGQTFQSVIGLGSVTGSVYSAVYTADITLTYSANAIEWLSAESLKQDFIITRKEVTAPGQLRITAASRSSEGVVTKDGDLLRIQWKASAWVPQATRAQVAVTKATVTNGLQQSQDAQLTSADIQVVPAPRRGGSSSGSSGSAAPAPATVPPSAVKPAVPGQPASVSIPLGEPVKETAKDGRTVSKAVLDANAVIQALQGLTAAQAKDEIILQADVAGKEDIGMIVIPAGKIAAFLALAPKATLSFTYDGARYDLPLQSIDIAALAKSLNKKAEDITLVIRIEKLAAGDAALLSDKAKSQGVKLLNAGLNFHVTAEAGDQQMVVSDYGQTYVTRSLTLPGGVDSQLAAAVRFDSATGELTFVPAQFHKAAGSTTVTIYSTSNSIYTVVQASKSFADLRGHWAQASVESMASRFLVKGTSENEFAPDKQITRAEFAVLLTRAMGLAPRTGSSYSDVASADWYAGAVGAASAAGIVDGFENGSFQPNGYIAREQMAVMIARALKLAPAEGELQADPALLESFSDNAAISGYAKEGVALALKANIVNGQTATAFVPAANATRAEAAVMIERMLKHIAFQ